MIRVLDSLIVSKHARRPGPNDSDHLILAHILVKDRAHDLLVSQVGTLVKLSTKFICDPDHLTVSGLPY